MAEQGAKGRKSGMYTKVCRYTTPHFEVLSNAVMSSAVVFKHLVRPNGQSDQLPVQLQRAKSRPAKHAVFHPLPAGEIPCLARLF